MGRMTKGTKEVIAKRALSRAFDKREAKLKAEEHQLASDVYCDIYPTKTREMMAEMPAGFLPSSRGLRVSFEGGERYAILELESAHRLAEKHTSRAAKVYDKDHPLSARRRALVEKVEQLRIERREMYEELWAVLNAVTTLGKLIKVWPEVEPLVSDLVASESSGTLPAMKLDNLNRRMAL